ncbi:unnamed protein product [Sympodiomycopsis kandeliae]
MVGTFFRAYLLSTSKRARFLASEAVLPPHIVYSMTVPYPPNFTPEPVNLIIDTDPGVDDVLSFFLALSQPHVNVLGFSLTFGNTTLDYARDNVLRTFNVLKKQWQWAKDTGNTAEKAKWNRLFGPEAKEIQLALGAEGPLGGRQRFTASYFHGRDGLSSIAFLEGDPFPVPICPVEQEEQNSSSPYVPAPLKLNSKASADMILEQLAAHPEGSVRIAAIGPVTNLALAWQKDPATFARVGIISIMGGAIDVPGNTAPESEFNTYADPWAAKVLLEDAVGHEALKSRPGGRLPIELLPLDITSRHTVQYGRLMGNPHTPLGHFISSILKHPRKMTNSYAPPGEPFNPARDDLFQAHDPLAVAHAIFTGPSTIQYHATQSDRLDDGDCRTDEREWEYQERQFAIEAEGTITRGMCVVDRRSHGKTHKGRSGKSRAENEHDAEDKLVPAKRSAEEGAEANGRPTVEPVPGLVSVVTESPLHGKWFEEIFSWSLTS